MQGTWVQALVWEDPTCCGTVRPVSHNYWACAFGACALQQERPRQWEACAPWWRVAPTRRNWRKPSHRNKDPTQPKINKFKKKESCTTMFIVALFTIAKTWKQPKCPSTDEWIKKMWHIYTVEYYSSIKRNEIELFLVRWMDLESVIQSEVSQKEKNKYSMLTHIYGI